MNNGCFVCRSVRLRLACTATHNYPVLIVTKTQDLAARVASYSRRVLVLGKAAFYRQQGMELPDAYRYGTGVMVDNLCTVNDAKHGIDAFLGKRAPTWTHT